jgi:hypothetical protein
MVNSRHRNILTMLPARFCVGVTMVACMLCLCGSAPVLDIIAPVEGKHEMVIQGRQDADVGIQYVVVMDSNNDTESSLALSDLIVCMNLFRVAPVGQRTYVTSGCFPAVTGSLAFSHSAPGSYQMDATLKYATGDTKFNTVTRNFHVTPISQSSPTLWIPVPNPVYYLPPLVANGGIAIDYKVTSSLFPVADFQLCAVLEDIQTRTALMNRFCLNIENPSAPALILHNLPPGQYPLVLDLATAHDPDRLAISGTEQRALITVKSFVDAMPMIRLEQHSPEYGLEAGVNPKTHKGDTEIRVWIDAADNSIRSWTRVCVSVVHQSNPHIPQQLLAFHPESQRSLSVANLMEGEYDVSLTVCAPTGQAQDYHHFPQTTVTTTLVARYMVEFEPSYEWQRLNAWHTVPAGAETRYDSLTVLFELAV